MPGGGVWSTNAPLTLISSLLCLLQLGQSCGQTLLCTVQLLLNQLDTPVQGSYITLSLQEHKSTEPGSDLIRPSTRRSLRMESDASAAHVVLLSCTDSFVHQFGGAQTVPGRPTKPAASG